MFMIGNFKKGRFKILLNLKVFGLVWFYGISIFIGYLMPNPFNAYKQFFFKQFSLV